MSTPSPRFSTPSSLSLSRAAPRRRRSRRDVLGLGVGALGLAVLAACGSSTSTEGGIRVVSPTDAAAVQADPPAGLQIIDLRTPEEYAEGHLNGSAMIDFYEADFADRIGALERDQPYLIYCRSGNRSGQTRELMDQLGFSDVREVDGGIVAWTEAQLPVAR